MEEDAEGISATIRDMVSYLRCTLDPLAFSLEGIEELFGIVKSSHENLLRLKTTRNNWGYPSELITALRLLCAQGKIIIKQRILVIWLASRVLIHS